jgi:GNAT superfamily N-acetyltransferase
MIVVRPLTASVSGGGQLGAGVTAGVWRGCTEGLESFGGLTCGRDTYFVRAPIDVAEFQVLRTAAWGGPTWWRLEPVLERSVAWVCAYRGTRLVGFVNVAGDGGANAFLLDPAVHPAVQREGIGTTLVMRAVEEARAAGCEWIHVDTSQGLRGFYEACGVSSAEWAGSLYLK